MLDSSLIGKAVDYGDYTCVIDSILDYQEGIVQLRITSGNYKGFSFSVDSYRIHETYDGLIFYVDIKRTPTLWDIVEFNEMLWKVIDMDNNVITIEKDGWSCSYSIHDMDKKNHIFSVSNNTKQITKPINLRKLYDYEVSKGWYKYTSLDDLEDIYTLLRHRTNLCDLRFTNFIGFNDMMSKIKYNHGIVVYLETLQGERGLNGRDIALMDGAKLVDDGIYTKIIYG